MKSRSLPQNKTLVGSEQLSKFRQFAQKGILMIWALSSRKEGIIMAKRSRRTCWDLEPAVGVAGDSGATPRSHSRCRRRYRSCLTLTEVGPTISPPCELDELAHVRRWCRSQLTVLMHWGERNKREREKERGTIGVRKRGSLGERDKTERMKQRVPLVVSHGGVGWWEN